MSNNIFTLSDLDRCKPKTIANRMHNYLTNPEQHAPGINPAFVYLSDIVAVEKFYAISNRYFGTDKKIDPLDYHEDVMRLYKTRTWNTVLVDFLRPMRHFLLPQEWLALWKYFYKVTIAALLEKDGNPNNPILRTLEAYNNQITREERIALQKERAAQKTAEKKAKRKAKMYKQMGLVYRLT